MKQGFNDLVGCDLLEDGRNIRLKRDLIFIDSNGRKWVAEIGRVTNGANIPKFLWIVTGSPLNGKYRRASVIHDTECDDQKNAWQDVHKVFYEMMIFDGVPHWKAVKMYKAVYYFGPRW